MTGVPRWAWILSGAALTAVVLVADLAHAPSTGDAGWFLHITSRAGDGDLPYEDFFLGVLPFPLWANLGATALLGTEIAVQKLLIVAAYVTSALVAARIALTLGVSPLGAGLVCLASLAYVPLPTGMPYSPLSYLFLLAALSLVLGWRRAGDASDQRRARTLLALAGAAAGLSLAGKQTVGAAAVLALLACVLAYSPRGAGQWLGKLRDASLAGAVAAGVVIVVVAPVALGGGLEEFWYQAFDKSEYIQNSSVSYLSGVGDLAELAVDPDGEWTALRLNTVFLVPILTALALAAAALRSRRAELIPVATFAAAAVAAALPRAAYFKVADAVPLCALAIAVAWTAARQSAGPPNPGRARGMKVAGAAAAVILTAILAANLIREPVRSFNEGADVGGVDHYRGSLFPRPMRDQARDQADVLRQAELGGDVFILTPVSGFLYLVSGVDSTTRHDLATLDTMRDRGQEEVIAALRGGEIESVCLGNYVGNPQRPEQLDRWVRAEMEPADAGSTTAGLLPWQCVIYEFPAARESRSPR